jgi:hypothetical protein
LAFVASRVCLFEEFPELVCIEKESFDFVGGPDAEGATTAGRSIAVATEDASGAHGFVTEIVFVVSAQGTMSIERPDLFAVGTWIEFEIQQKLFTISLSWENSR